MTGSTIIFLPDFEEGHVFPSFKIAKNLKDAGYNICYVGIHDVMEIVEKQGFNYQVVFDDIYYQGYLKELGEDRLSDNRLKPKHYEQLIKENVFDEVIQKLQPKLIISSLALSLEALLFYYKFKIPQIIFNFRLPMLNQPLNTVSQSPSTLCIKQVMSLTGDLPEMLLEFMKLNNVSFKTLNDLVSPLNRIPQFLLCPRELYIYNYIFDKKDIFVGPCVREPIITADEIRAKYLPKDGNKKIIYGSIGSQISVYPEKAKKFYKLLLHCAHYLDNYHFILSMDEILSLNAVGEIPDNVSIFRWVPQVELLPHLSLAIIHGGLGTIKECIYYGIPMLLIPMGRDQIDNAQRIKKHNLGLQNDLENLNLDKMLAMVNELLANDNIKKNINNLKNIFREQENMKTDVEFIRKYIGDPK